MAPGTEGGVTRFMPSGEQMSIYDAAMKYQAAKTPLVIVAGKEYGTGSSRDWAAKTPLVIVAGKEYGTGSSRDWAAKGTMLLGVKAVLVESFERIHRSNLVGMGVLPLQFKGDMTRKSLNLDGSETFDVTGLAKGIKPGMNVTVKITRANGKSEEITAICRIDTLDEVEYFKHGGILPYVLRNLAKAA
jgi:aconitate hydratase